MPPLARGVVALPKPGHGCPAEERFDPPTQARRGFGLGVPDRPQHLHDQLGVAFSDR